MQYANPNAYILDEVLTQKRLKFQINYPNLETRAEKLKRKSRRREQDYKSVAEPLILANLSKRHQDYGMSPAAHLRAKADRLKNIS